MYHMLVVNYQYLSYILYRNKKNFIDIKKEVIRTAASYLNEM